MRSFLDLVSFEYKKIFIRKGAVTALIIVTILTVISPALILIGDTYIDGEFFETKYEAMEKNRDYARALSGRSIDETLMLEVKDAYSKIPSVGSNESYVGTPEYQKYGRPYANIYEIVYSVYGSSVQLMQNLTQEQMQSLYNVRHEKTVDNINAMKISDKSKENLIQLDSEIQTPFIFSYIGGYDRFFAIMATTGIFIAFAVAVCVAPIFSGEYIASGASQLILSSKYGKNILITAKFFTAITFSIIVSLLLTIFTYLVCGAIFGFDGADAPLQLYWRFFFSPYPLTMLQTTVIFSVNVICAIIFVGAFTLLLSSKFKSPFAVIIVVSLFIFVPIMINVSDNNILLFNLMRLLPSIIMMAEVSFSTIPFEIFGLPVLLYVFLPVVAAVSSAALLPFAWRAFKNHQIS